MNKSTFFVMVSLLCATLAWAQGGKSSYSLDDYLNGKYGARGVAAPRSLPDGESYTRVSGDGSMILKYAWRTGKVTDTLFNAKTARECSFERIGGYDFSDNGEKILIYTDRENVYRHSFKAVYYVYNVKRNLVEPLSTGKQQMATFSPDGRNVAFVRDNNLFLKKLDFETEVAVTTDGEYNKIINGLPDWVYEEEFSTNKSFCWSPDNQMIAFIRYDESEVPMYSFDLYGGMKPTYNDAKLYPKAYTYKYPKPGEKNSIVTVHTYDTKTKDIKKMNLPIDAEGYVPRIRFMPKGDLAIFTLNRHQNVLNLYLANPRSTLCKSIMKEENQYYIDLDFIDQTVITDNNIVWVSEKDGFSHVYLYSSIGTFIRQMTKGEWDVTKLLGYDEKTQTVYYESAEESPIRRNVYKVDAKGKKSCLTPEKGTNSVTFSSDFKYYQNTFQNAITPPVTKVIDAAKDKVLYTVEDNAAVKEAIQGSGVPVKEFITFNNHTGETLNAWIVKPANFSASKKYPVLMTQYSGPNSQSVKDVYGMGWEQYLASEGYIVFCVDGRGTGARGEAFRKSHTYMKLGTSEIEDQIAGAKYLASLSYVDGGRIGIWGWSYGGFTTLMALTKGEGVFKVGIAVAPVTDFRFYDTVYTERYMRTPNENASGYKNGSPIENASKLKGKLLLVHGTADDNVHYQNSLEFAEALVQANIQFDMAFYTNRDHSIWGGNTRKHLYIRMSDFILKNL